MTMTKPAHDEVYSFKNETFSGDDFVRNGKITPLGIDYLLQFKRFNLFDTAGTALLFTLCLPLIVPLVIVRLVLLSFVFGTGFFLKKYLSIHLDDYPKIVRLIYLVCLGVLIRSKDDGRAGIPHGADPGQCEQSTVIVSNHNSRFDAMLLANLHHSDATFLAAAKASFFGRLIIGSGLCSRSMEEGIALDTKEGRAEWRRRLGSAYCRPMLFFPEGRVVHRPHTIITFQNHLFLGQKVDIVCKTSMYRSYFLDHTQIEMPFFKAPYARLKNKSLWDSIVEGLPFFVSFVTVFKTEVIGKVHLKGDETLEKIDELLYSLYVDKGYGLVSIDPLLVKKLMHGLYL